MGIEFYSLLTLIEYEKAMEWFDFSWLWGSFTWRHPSCQPSPAPWQPQMRSLPRHDLLGKERWLISQRRRARILFLSGLLLGLICIGIQGVCIHTHTHTHTAHQSLLGSNDQTIDNTQRTMRAYFESGSDS